MTPHQRQPDGKRGTVRAPARAPQQASTDKRDAGAIDAAEFWRRLGL
ncbi:MAG: hypothetical protein QM690_15215 [Sphingobium sp.]